MEASFAYQDRRDQQLADFSDLEPLSHQYYRVPPTIGEQQLHPFGEVIPPYPHTVNADDDTIYYQSYSSYSPFLHSQTAPYQYAAAEGLGLTVPPSAPIAVTPQLTNAMEFGQSTFLSSEPNHFFYLPYTSPVPTNNISPTSPTYPDDQSGAVLSQSQSSTFQDSSIGSIRSPEAEDWGSDLHSLKPHPNFGGWQTISFTEELPSDVPRDVTEHPQQPPQPTAPPTNIEERRGSTSSSSLSSFSSSYKTRTFRCKTCSAEFKRRRDRERHIRSLHTRLTPYFCQGCNEGFVRSDARGRHWRNYPLCRDKHQSIIDQRMAQSPDSS